MGVKGPNNKGIREFEIYLVASVFLYVNRNKILETCPLIQHPRVTPDTRDIAIVLIAFIIVALAVVGSGRRRRRLGGVSVEEGYDMMRYISDENRGFIFSAGRRGLKFYKFVFFERTVPIM